MKNVFKLAAVVIPMMLAAQAEAQLSGFKKPAIPGTSSSDASSSSAVSQEAIVQSYVDANVLVLNARAKLAEAFGLKDEVAAINAEAESLQSASTQAGKDEFKSSATLSDRAMAAVQAKIDSGAELTAEGRVSYVEGLSLTAQSVIATKDMAQDAKSFSASAKSDISSASMMKKASVTKKYSAGMFVATELPGFTSRLTKNFGSLAAYAKSADIPVPDDATDALASVGFN